MPVPSLKVPLLAAALAASALPATAAASTRYAVKDKGANSGACAADAPCTLEAAVTGAGSGDEIVLAGGDYKLKSTLTVPAGAVVRGADGVVPRLIGDLDAAGPTVSSGPGSAVRNLYIKNDGKGVTGLQLSGGTAEDLTVEAKKASAVTVVRDGDTVLLRDSVLTAEQNDTNAVVVNPGGLLALGTVQMRNLTVNDKGDRSTGIYSAAGVAGVSLLNVIARGKASDLGGNLTSTMLVRHSNFRPWLSQGVVVDLGGNQSGSPLFVKDGEDFRERVGSPTIDAGAMDAYTSPSDMLGLARGSISDIGAYEYAASTGPGPARAAARAAAQAPARAAAQARGRAADPAAARARAPAAARATRRRTRTGSRPPRRSRSRAGRSTPSPRRARSRSLCPAARRRPSPRARACPSAPSSTRAPARSG
jgi:hypothetical protein